MNYYKQRLKRNISLYYFSSFFSSLIFIIPIWVAFERQFLNYTQMAFLETFAMSTNVLLELPTGALADIIGRKWTVIIGWLLRGAGNIFTAFSINGLMLIMGYGICSIGTTFISGADEALIYDSLKEIGKDQEFKKVSSKKSFIFQIGLVLSTLAGGYLYEPWVGLPYLIYGISELVSMAINFFMEEPRIDTEKFTLQSYIRQTKTGFKELFKNNYVKKLSWFYVLVGGISWSSQFFFNQPFASDVGFNEIEKSWLFSIIRLINSLILFKLVHLEKFFTKKKAFLMFPILMIFSYLPGYWATKTLAVFLIPGAMFVSTARWTILGQYTNDEFSSKNRATAISSLGMLVSLVYIFLVTFSGKFMEVYTTKFIYTILGIVSLIFVLPLGINLAFNHQQSR